MCVQEKPNFTGRWNLNPEKSELQFPPPTSSLFVVEHQEPRFHVTRTHVYGDRSDTISFELTTDGQECELKFGDFRALARMRWDGVTLVTEMTVRVKDDEGTNVVWYSLEDDRRTFVARERWRSTNHHHDNLWVFERD